MTSRLFPSIAASPSLVSAISEAVIKVDTELLFTKCWWRAESGRDGVIADDADAKKVQDVTADRQQAEPDGTTAVRKTSYAVPCASDFRDAILDLAERRHVNVGDIARSVMLCLPVETVNQARDPGEPDIDDREGVTLQSGPAAGKPWRRKPRLQVRLPAGYTIVQIRKALGLALAIDSGEIVIAVSDRDEPQASDLLAALHDENTRLRAIIDALQFQPLKGGVRTQAQALHILGYAPGDRPTYSGVKRRFRLLAAIYHPDGARGDHTRMSQLNEAMSLINSKKA